MLDFFAEEKRRIRSSLAQVSKSYLRAGLRLFHQSRQGSSSDFQPAVGMLCIGIELMLKTLVARKAFHLLFTDLPKDLEIALCYQDSVPTPIPGSAYALDLSHSVFKTIQLDEAVSLAYTLAPKVRDELRGSLKTVAEIRNAAVHSLVPEMKRYQLDRIAHAALRLNELVSDAKDAPSGRYSRTDEDEKFLADFDQERIERVGKKLETARTTARKTGERGDAMVDDWSLLEKSCPVCGSGGLLQGDTTLERESDGEPFLTFLADSFACDYCGLSLEDSAELRLASLEEVHDRTDHLDRWFRDHPEDGMARSWAYRTPGARS